MPSVSQKQHNAMEAAAHGHSTLGIPKSVGEDFSKADKGKKFAGGGPITDKTIEPVSTTKTPPGSLGVVQPPTMGVSSSYPPPPGERKQGPRNYSKKG